MFFMLNGLKPLSPQTAKVAINPRRDHLACCVVYSEWMAFEVPEMVIAGKNDGFRRSVKNQNRVMGVIPIS